MAERKIVYRNDGAAKRTMILDDDYPDRVVVHTEQDMAQTIENNKAMRELHPEKSNNKLLARGVPIAVAEQALREDWDQNDWKRWLNDPDNAAFRVWPGRV
jgi:hypothetical protein